MARFSDLPTSALEGVVLALLAPPSTPADNFGDTLALSDLLTKCGRKLSEATIRVLYGRLQTVLPVLGWDDEAETASATDREPASLVPSCSPGQTPAEQMERARWSTVLANPDRYAEAVRSLVISPPSRPDQIPVLDTIPVDQGEEIILRLLRVCRRLETLEWKGIAGWSDDVGLALLSMPSLRHLGLLSPPLHASATTTQNPDLPRVSILHALPQSLRSLAVSRLSAVGHKNFHLHLTTLPAHAPLDKLSVDSPMLDDALCEVIACAGRGIKHLWLRTSGTKLTDRGIADIFEGCVELESLTLSEVEGRLSRATWSKIESIPETFKHLRFEISEAGPHHSWMADHLSSLTALQMANLETLSVTRVTPPFALYPIPPQGHTAPPVDGTCEPSTIPEDLLEHILDQGLKLRVLELDFWDLSPAQLARVAKTLTHLERLKVALDAPFSKLLSLTTAFSHLVNLQTLHVTIPSKHVPLPSVTPLNPAPLHTPSTSPVTTKGGALPPTPVIHTTALPSPPLSTSDLPMQHEGIHPLLLEKIHDTTLPPIRDVKRFVKRVPKLRELGWVGRAGVGYWLATRDTSDEGKNGHVGSGRRSSTASIGAAGRAVAELEFVSLALLWKDEWEEASKGPPRWLFKSHAHETSEGKRARSATCQSLSKSFGSLASLEDRSDGGGTSKERQATTESATPDLTDEPSQFTMDDVPAAPLHAASSSPRQSRKAVRKLSTADRSSHRGYSAGSVDRQLS